MTVSAPHTQSARPIITATPAARARLASLAALEKTPKLQTGTPTIQYKSSFARVTNDPTKPSPLIDISGYRFTNHTRADGQKVSIEITGSLVVPEKLAPGGIELPPLHVPNLSFICFGDSGKGTQAQREIAEALVRMGKARNISFGVHTGDIFYPNGVQSADDPNIQRLYTNLYKDLPNIQATLGNHDYGHINGTGIPEAIAEAANAGRAGFDHGQRYFARQVISPQGSVRLIMLDTSTISVDLPQINWLRSQLEKDDSTYTIVVGHHPIHNNGWHGSSSIMKKLLLPLLDAKADMYLCGHEHNQQELFSDGGLPVILSGAAAEARPTWPGGKAHFTSVRRGAAFFTIDKDGIHVDFMSAYKDRSLHTDTFQRRERKPLPPPLEPTAQPLRMPIPPRGYYRSACDAGPMLSARKDKALA